MPRLQLTVQQCDLLARLVSDALKERPQEYWSQAEYTETVNLRTRLEKCAQSWRIKSTDQRRV